MQSNNDVEEYFDEDEFATEVIFRRPDQIIHDEEEEEESDEEDIVLQEPDDDTEHNSMKLPSIPRYKPLSNRVPLRDGYVKLPVDLNIDDIEPMAIFNQFFNTDMLNTIVDSTNKYAENNLEESDKNIWSPIKKDDLILWIAIVIYQGMHKESSIKSYWSTCSLEPSHPINELMTYERFRLIKRYLHVSEPKVPNDLENPENLEESDEPSNSDKKTPFYEKLEPLLSHVRSKSKELYVPKGSVSVDEMMVRFSGRSKDIVRMKGKPIPKGYKIMSLCDSGYTFTFLPTSRDEPCDVERISGITYTGCVVNHLVTQLPYKSRSYDIYMDNYFSSVALFKHFKENKIGACGTSKTTSLFTRNFNLQKNKNYDWNTRSAVKEQGVLAVFWQDSGPVKMLTTIHKIGKIGGKYDVEKNRKKPRKTSTNAASVRKQFEENEHQKKLMIPKMIDDYNQNMNGVDIADQYRSYYNTQQICRRNWVPLFYWLLDTSIINSYILFNKLNKKKGKKLIEHKQFRKDLLWGLVDSVKTQSVHLRNKRSEDNAPSKKRKRASKNFALNPKRLCLESKHWPIPTLQRGSCVWCCYQAKKNNTSTQNLPRPTVWCPDCEVPLCFRSDRNCHAAYHSAE